MRMRNTGYKGLKYVHIMATPHVECSDPTAERKVWPPETNPIPIPIPDPTPVGPEWELYYWHFLPGRGDFVRLLFAEAGIEYKDVCRDEKSSAAALKFYKGERGPEEFPVLAPPIIRNTETKFVLCQTPAILEYLGRKFHLCPQPENNLELQAQAMQVNLIVADYIAEGHDAYHPVKKTGSYESQKEEAKPYIEAFVKERMPRYLKHFDEVLKESKEIFFFSDEDGDYVTYAAIAVFHALRATEFQFPEDYKKLCSNELKKFYDTMKMRPRIKAFLEDPEKSLPFCGNSMM